MNFPPVSPFDSLWLRPLTCRSGWMRADSFPIRAHSLIPSPRVGNAGPDRDAGYPSPPLNRPGTLPERNPLMLRVIGVGLLAVGVAGLLVMAAHIAWQEVKTLRHVSQLDEWASDLPEWH